MRTLMIAAAVAATPLAACTTYGNGYGYGSDWSREYRPGSYQPYALGPNDAIYRGDDDRYYCRRSDGTVGLVVGAGIGALLGDRIARHGHKTLGAILGAAAGGAVGYATERSLSCQ